MAPEKFDRFLRFSINEFVKEVLEILKVKLNFFCKYTLFVQSTPPGKLRFDSFTQWNLYASLYCFNSRPQASNKREQALIDCQRNHLPKREFSELCPTVKIVGYFQNFRRGNISIKELFVKSLLP